MELTFSEIEEKVNANRNKVYDIFKDFFGEKYVDLQPEHKLSKQEILNFGKETGDGKCFELSDSDLQSLISASEYDCSYILVYWPRVKVTNEYGKYIYIDDLYARIKILNNGYLQYSESLQFTRATYPIEQLVSDYCHSHVVSIPREGNFSNCCLGSGPIRNTMDTLRNSNDELMWQLFCQELSMYVTVESVRGIPYHRLEEVRIGNITLSKFYTPDGNFSTLCDHFFPTANLRNQFVEYYLKHGHLVFNYINGAYSIGLSCYEYLVDISNCMIDWINSYNFRKDGIFAKYYSDKIFIKAKAGNGVLYDNTRSYTRLNCSSEYEGRRVCTFKGQEKKLHITTGTNSPLNDSKIVDPLFAMALLAIILRTLNYHCTNEETERNTTSSEETTAQPVENVLFL